MLIHCFNSLKGRGNKRVTLGCEAENISAVNLYKKLGLWVSSRYHVYSWFRDWEKEKKTLPERQKSETFDISISPKCLRVVKRVGQI